MKENLIIRKKYINQLFTWKDKNVIKVVVGLRRVGKSVTFLTFIEELQKKGVNKNQIIHLNLEDMANKNLLDASSLYNFIDSKLLLNQMNYIFIDEVQQCKDFEKAIDSLYIKENTDIYLTGSNAYFLSGELATLLSGRYVQIEVLPFSFSEYIEFQKLLGNDNLATQYFNPYLKYGSLPFVSTLNNENEINTYLEGIYNTVLVKDISVHNKITDILLLQKIIKFLCAAIGSPISTKKITDTLISSGRKISTNTVEHYLSSILNAFIFYEVPRFDIKGKEILKSLSKFYITDVGLRNFLYKSSTQDLGHVIENLVYLELRRRFQNVYVGKLGENEIDFIAKDNESFYYFQVAANVSQEETFNREIKPLKLIKDNYPKFLLTLDDFILQKNIDGIIHKNIIEWLQEE